MKILKYIIWFITQTIINCIFIKMYGEIDRYLFTILLSFDVTISTLICYQILNNKVGE